MYKIVLGATLLFSIASCKKELPVVGGTVAQKMANEWWVMLTLNGQDVYQFGHIKLATYNAAANNNELWVDDLKNGYGFKVKTAANFDSLKFSAIGAANLYYDTLHPANFPKDVTISSGKIFVGAGHSKTGNVTDSIYMQAVFSDDPATTYTISGHARTKFTEDDY